MLPTPPTSPARVRTCRQNCHPQRHPSAQGIHHSRQYEVQPSVAQLPHKSPPQHPNHTLGPRPQAPHHPCKSLNPPAYELLGTCLAAFIPVPDPTLCLHARCSRGMGHITWVWRNMLEARMPRGPRGICTRKHPRACLRKLSVNIGQGAVPLGVAQQPPGPYNGSCREASHSQPAHNHPRASLPRDISFTFLSRLTLGLRSPSCSIQPKNFQDTP